MKKLFTFLSLFVLIGMSATVFAQDSGTTPFVNSTHTYQVTGTTGNSIILEVSTDANNTAAATTLDFTLVSPSSATQTSDGNPTVYTITWLNAGTYYVNISEKNASECLTTRQLQVVVSANTFDVYPIAAGDVTPNVDTSSDGVNDSGSKCTDASGTITDNSSTVQGTSTITFNVVRTIDSGDPDWKFDWAVASTGGDLVSVSFTTATAQTWTSGGSTSASGTGAVIPAATTGDIETITVVVENVANAESTVTLTTSNAVTNDSSAIPENDSANNVATVTLSATPVVGTITAN